MWLSRNQRIQGYRLRVRHELTKSAALRRSEDLGLMVAKKGRVSGLGRPWVRELTANSGASKSTVSFTGSNAAGTAETSRKILVVVRLESRFGCFA